MFDPIDAEVFSCSLRFKVSSEFLIVAVFLVTGLSSFLLTDVHFANAFIRIVLHEGQNVLNQESLVLRDSNVMEGSILNGIPTSSRD